MFRLAVVVACLVAVTAHRYSRLDKLLERLGASTPPPDPTSTSQGPPPHPLRHHHHLHPPHPDQDPLTTTPPPQADSNRFQTNSTRGPCCGGALQQFVQQFSKTNLHDWRKNARKTWDKGQEYKVTKNTPGVVAGVGSSEMSAHSLVVRHNLRMSRETVCRVPQLKVVRVAEHYPDSSRHYMPPCTRLHQCAQDTGCCPASQRCGPKATHRVELYFYVMSTNLIGSGAGKTGPAVPSIEKLAFYNHTECECQDRTDEMPRDTDPHANSVSAAPHHASPFTPKDGCECPSEYTVRYLANGSCSCDCFDKQRDCTKYKRGKEYFNHQDRLCIAMGKCKHPSCDFGVYMMRIGRCPRKHEKFRSWRYS